MTHTIDSLDLLALAQRYPAMDASPALIATAALDACTGFLAWRASGFEDDAALETAAALAEQALRWSGRPIPSPDDFHPDEPTPEQQAQRDAENEADMSVWLAESMPDFNYCEFCGAPVAPGLTECAGECRPFPPAPAAQRCRMCGCTGGAWCSWVAPDLCSACA